MPNSSKTPMVRVHFWQVKDYALWRLRDKPGQRTLSAFAAQPLSRSAPAQAGAPAHLPAWSPAAAAKAPPRLASGLGTADAGEPEQPGHEHGPARSSARLHLAFGRTVDAPAQAMELDQDAGHSAGAAAPEALASTSREPGVYAQEAAARLPEHGASHSAWQGRSDSNGDGLAAMDAVVNSPGEQCAAAGSQHGQAEPAVQQHPESPVAEPVQAPALRVAEQLPACDAAAVAGAVGPAVWDGPAWPGEEVSTMERQAQASTAARSASEPAPDGALAARAGAAAGAEVPDSGPRAERTDPGLSRGCSGESPGVGRDGMSGAASRAAEGPTSTSRPIWSLSEPSQGGFGGDARVHGSGIGASPGGRTGAANDAAAGTRPGSAHTRVVDAAATLPPSRGSWSNPEPHAALAVNGRAAAGEGTDQQVVAGAQRGAVQPRANTNPGPPVGTRTAEQISAAARAAKDILKGPPRSSRDDPAFQQTFWQASRLHFIGSWKARGCSLALPMLFLQAALRVSYQCMVSVCV